jgi:dTDP-4-amino-4,6-dideoxygalactose transaminase
MAKYNKYTFKINSDLRGSLIAVDSEFDLPFQIKRFFYISNLDNLERGFHAHRKCEQILFPIQGSFTLILDDGIEEEEFYLDKPNEGIYVPLFTWLKMKNFSSDCIIMVICSYKYDENEYIRDHDVFLEEIKKNKSICKISNFSLKEQTKLIKNEIINKIDDIIDSNEFVMGFDVLNFEKEFAKYNQSNYCIGVSNGCSALKIALKSLNLNNYKVITQANTYVAVPLVCEELNIPYDLIDIDDNLLMNLDKLEEYLLTNNKESDLWYESKNDFVVIIVHLYGNCVDMNRILELKNKYNFKLIEDSAQAHGSTFNGKKLGTFGDLGCFSFYPSKNLGAFGEGGAIVTNNEKYEKYCRMYRNYGSIERYKWEIIGANERMHNLQGGILSVKLKYLDDWNIKRNFISQIYNQNIKENKLLKILKPINNCSSNNHLFVLIVKNRDELKKYLEENNIMCAIHYPKPFYDEFAYQHKKEKFEKMELYKDKLLSLPMYPELSIKNVLIICDMINKYYS